MPFFFVMARKEDGLKSPTTQSTADEKEVLTPNNDAMNTTGTGWRKLSEGDERRGAASGEEIQIELNETVATTRDTAKKADAGSGAASVSAAEMVEYKVYRRRWFGLVQLTLLNVIVSWDVSLSTSSGPDLTVS